MHRDVCLNIVAEAIDLEALRLSGDFELLPYLYANSAGRDSMRAQVRAHPGVAKALALFDKLTVLLPKHSGPHKMLSSIHRHSRDAEALRNVLQRIRQVELDLGDSLQETLDFYAGNSDPKHREDLDSAIERFERLVQLTREGSRGATFAVAVGKLVEQRIAAGMMGLTLDADQVVALAEEAHAEAPSAATLWTLIRALLLRASRDLSRQDSTYAEMANRAGRSLPPGHLVAIALTRPGKSQHTAMTNADVRRAMTLIIEAGQRFPDDRDPWEWAMLRKAHPDEAAKVAEAVRRHQTWQIEYEIDSLLSPLSAVNAFEGFWYKSIDGNESEGLEILRRCAAQGVPMPFDVP